MGRNRHSVENCKNARDFMRAAKKQGAEICIGRGSHRKIYNDRGSVAIPCHGEGKEIYKYTRKKIVKQLAAIGITIIVLGLIVLSFMNGWIIIT